MTRPLMFALIYLVLPIAAWYGVILLARAIFSGVAS